MQNRDKWTNCASTFPELTSPRCESPNGPLVSGLTIMTRTPGRILQKNRNGFSLELSEPHLGLWPESFSQQSILTVPDSMSGRLCGAPRSTSLTLRNRRILFTLPWSCDIFIVDTWLFSLPVVAQRLHVNVNSGRIGSGSALGGKNEKQYNFDKLEQRSAAQTKNCEEQSQKRIRYVWNWPAGRWPGWPWSRRQC